MTVGEFIKNYVARNTTVRLWKNIGNGHQMLIDSVLMEWQVLSCPYLTSLKFDVITDIVCDTCPEAINIVVKEADAARCQADYNGFLLMQAYQKQFACEG